MLFRVRVEEMIFYDFELKKINFTNFLCINVNKSCNKDIKSKVCVKGLQS